MNSRDVIVSLYEDMMTANRKAEEALFNYNQRVAQITEEEIEKSERLKLAEIFQAERIKSRKDSDDEAKNHYSAYAFHKGEIERFSSLLQGIAAYKNLTIRQSLDPTRKTPINISGQ